jgi:mRNA interferase RelE/StbE
MGMITDSYAVAYHEAVVEEDIPRLSKTMKERVRLAIEKKLATHPEVFGKPLRRSLKGYRKLRVGDFRVIFRIEKKTVKVFIIDHRSTVYTDIEKRK